MILYLAQVVFTLTTKEKCMTLNFLKLFALSFSLVFSLQAFAAPKACVVNGVVQNTKLLFVIDKSGSNATTDPQGRRAEALLRLHREHKTNTCVKWGVTVFQDPGTRSLIHQTQQPALVSGGNTQIRQAIVALRKDPDQGATPVRAALLLARNTIAIDIQKYPNQVNKYLVLFITDGIPTDGTNAESLKQMVAEIQNLAAPGLVKVSSGYYGDPNNGSAINFASSIANIGNGKFVNFNYNPFDYEHLIVP